MASKRMSISALLSSDSQPSKHPESSPLQQSSSQHRLYRPENESVHDVDSFHRRSRESTSAESQSYSSSMDTDASANINASPAWYQPQVDSRVSQHTQETRYHARPSYSYAPASDSPPFQIQTEQGHSRPYYPSPPLYSDRYSEREHPVDSQPRRPAQTQPSYAQHTPSYPTFRPNTGEYRERERERDSRQFPSSSPRPKNTPHTDTSDSLLSVLTRTVASEGVPVGPGMSRNATNVNFASSPPLHPPTSLSRRGRDKDVVEHDRSQIDRMREVTHPQDQREYQRSSFPNAETRSFPYHYHPDLPRSPEMQMLPNRQDPRGTPIHSTSASHYTPPSRSPSTSQSAHSNTVVSPHYPQPFSVKSQPHPPSHAQHTQLRSHIESYSSSSSKSAHPHSLPPRLDLTLPLSLTPATISGQITSPISPNHHPHSTASNIGGPQVQPRSTQYLHNVSSSRGPIQPKERSTPQGASGKAPNAITPTFLSPRNQMGIPHSAQPHPSSIPHLISASNLPSPSLHTPSFVLPLRPISPQQRPSSRRAEIVPPLGLEPGKDAWEKNQRHSKIPIAHHSLNNVDVEAVRKPSEKNATMPKRPVSYDQRRVDESRMGIAEVISEKTRPPSIPSQLSYPQDRDIVSNDRGFKLWSNGPGMEDKVPQRKAVDTYQRPISINPKSSEELDIYPKRHRSRPEEPLTRISTLPLGTLPVPNFERQQSATSHASPHVDEKSASHVFRQVKEDRGQSFNVVNVASPRPRSPSLPPFSRVNILNPQPQSLHPYLKDRNETLGGNYPQTVSALPPAPRTALSQSNSEMVTRDIRSPLKVSEHSRTVSPPKSECATSPSSPRKQPSHSPHLSATDTLSSTKNSEAELRHPSPCRSLPPALPSDAPVLYDSIQYPLPSSAGGVDGPVNEGQREVAKIPNSRQSPVLIDTEVKHDSVSVYSEVEQRSMPADKEVGQSPPPAADETGQGPILAADKPKEISVSSVHATMTRLLTPTPPQPPIAVVTPLPVPTLSETVTAVADTSFEDRICVHREDSLMRHDVEMAEVTDRPSTPSEEGHGHHAEKAMEDTHAEVAPHQAEKSPLPDELDKIPIEVTAVSLESAHDQLIPSQPNEPMAASLVEIKEESASVHVVDSSKDPSSSPLVDDQPPRSPSVSSPKSRGQTLRCDEQSTHGVEEPIREAHDTSLMSDLIRSSEAPNEGEGEIQLEDVEKAKSPKVNSPKAEILSTNTIQISVTSETAIILNEDRPSEAHAEPADGESSVLDVTKKEDEDTVDVNMMDISLDVVASSQVDDQSLEDELLSLVDDVQIKSDIKPSVVPLATLARKISKVKPPKPRGLGKPTKSKAIRPDSEPLTPSSPNSGNLTALGSSSKPLGRSNKLVSGSRKKTGNASSTARSVSVMPEPTPDLTPVAAEERLYCICGTPYNEDKIMIACDRCDEWYHPSCVGMPDQEVDLVDQFICEKCKKAHPGLKTTYKARCYRGTHYIPEFDKAPPCWKAAKGAFSKYCCDACGIAHMRAKIAQSGKDLNEIWPLVRHAKKREGISVEYLHNGSNASKKIKLENGEGVEFDDGKIVKTPLNGTKTNVPNTKVRPCTNGDKIRLEALKHNLGAIRSSRDKFKLELEYVMTRRRLLDLAVERASDKFCGWDTRLEMGDHEWARWIIGVEGKKALYSNQGEDDGDDGESENSGKMSWLCHGPVECPRHNGWKTVRDLELQMEVDSKNGSIKQLTETERDLKSKIEELYPKRSSRKAKRITR